MTVLTVSLLIMGRSINGFLQY